MMNPAIAIMFVVVSVPIAQAQDHSEHAHHAPTPSAEVRARHIPPDPPQSAMRDMSEEEMSRLMDMDDTDAYLLLRADALEWRHATQDALAWDVHAWYGNDYNKLWLKSEGHSTSGEADTRNELLWDRVVSRWWSAQVGARHDVGEGPSRTWAAMGLQGMAPYFFEIEGTAYLGEQGRTALRLSAEYELVLSQRIVLEPKLEFDVYGQRDTANLLGPGLSTSEFGLRLRYEVRPEFAPYIGVAWSRAFGDTAALHRAAGREVDEVEWLAGVRWWF